MSSEPQRAQRTAPIRQVVTAEEATPKPIDPAKALNASALALLKLEVEIRKARSLPDLAYLAANEFRTISRAQQTFVVSRRARGDFTIDAATGISVIDHASPLITAIASGLKKLDRQQALDKANEFDAAALMEAPDEKGSTRAQPYPLRFMVWLPFRSHDGETTGGLIMARAMPWTAHEIAVAQHLADATCHARQALAPTASIWRLKPRLTRRRAMAAALMSAIVALMPVSMSALAPVEVVPKDPHVVTAGVEGVVEAVLIDPSQRVTKGMPLVKLVDTVLRNRYEIAEREVFVAAAKHKKAAQLAFTDLKGRQELALAQAELDVRLAERDFAKEMVARTVIVAERDGMAVFADKKDLIGRPVAAGEKLMELAEPSAVQLRIDLPVAEAIVIQQAARVKVFLDSAPLSPVSATLVRADYQARARDGQPLAFRLIASQNSGQAPLRLGVRGTAQVYSSRVPLAYYLFRRPIAAARQWAGL